MHQPDFEKPPGKVVVSFSLSPESMTIIDKILEKNAKAKNRSQVVDTIIRFYGEKLVD